MRYRIDMQRIKRRGLLSAAGGAANIDASGGALLAQDRGAAGNRLEIRDVTDAN